MNHIQCLGDNKNVGNGSSSINMNIIHNILLPSYDVWILLSHMIFDFFGQFPFIVTQIQCLSDHKMEGKWLNLHKYQKLPKYYSPIF